MPGNAGIPVADAFRPGGLNWAFDSGRSFFILRCPDPAPATNRKKAAVYRRFTRLVRPILSIKAQVPSREPVEVRSSSTRRWESEDDIFEIFGRPVGRDRDRVWVDCGGHQPRHYRDRQRPRLEPEWHVYVDKQLAEIIAQIIACGWRAKRASIPVGALFVVPDVAPRAKPTPAAQKRTTPLKRSIFARRRRLIPRVMQCPR